MNQPRPHPISRLRKALRNSSLSIAFKWTLYIGALISLVMGLLGWFLTSQQNRVQIREIESFGKTLVEQLAFSASEPLLAEDHFNLQGLVSRQTHGNHVVGAAIIGRHGIRTATGVVPPDLHQSNSYESASWTTDDGMPVISFYSPIIFRKVVAGTAEITLERQFVDQYRQETIHTIGYATSGLILIAALLSYLLSRSLTRPIKTLADAAHLPNALGDSQDGQRQDEIGQVYTHFERMSAGLVEKRQIEAALSRYVAPAVANQILANLSSERLPNQQVEGSILFCDIVGFTRLSENLSPDQVANLLNHYLGFIAEAAHLAGGTVDKFIGDNAMILFGVPEQSDDHADRALRCGWLILSLVEHLNRTRTDNGQQAIEFRIGINSGPMLAGNIGAAHRLEYTVIGDTVNLAARLCGLAPANGILLSQATARQARLESLSEVSEQPPMKVKGRARPVTAFVATRAAPELCGWLDATVAAILDGGGEQA